MFQLSRKLKILMQKKDTWYRFVAPVEMHVDCSLCKLVHGVEHLHCSECLQLENCQSIWCCESLCI